MDTYPNAYIDFDIDGNPHIVPITDKHGHKYDHINDYATRYPYANSGVADEAGTGFVAQDGAERDGDSGTDTECICGDYHIDPNCPRTLK